MIIIFDKRKTIIAKRLFQVNLHALTGTTKHKRIAVSDELRSDELRSDELRSDELRSDELRSDELRSDELRVLYS